MSKGEGDLHVICDSVSHDCDGSARFIQEHRRFQLLPTLRIDARLSQEVDEILVRLGPVRHVFPKKPPDDLLHGRVVPDLVLHRVQLVREDPCALVLPERDQHLRMGPEGDLGTTGAQ